MDFFSKDFSYFVYENKQFEISRLFQKRSEFDSKHFLLLLYYFRNMSKSKESFFCQTYWFVDRKGAGHLASPSLALFFFLVINCSASTTILTNLYEFNILEVQ